MFGAISEIISALSGRAGLAEAGVDSERVALAALLVHVAAVDGVVKTSESAELETMLADRFALGRSAARQLISFAQRADEEATDFSEFTASLKRRLGPAERRKVIDMMWAIARADGHVHEFEETLIARVAQLLDIQGAGGNA